MRKSWTIVAVLAVVVVLGGCASTPLASSDARPAPSTAENTMTEDDDLPEAAPAFAAHFTDPIYNDPADDFAPFGTDEGWDILYEWTERRDELDVNTTVAELIGESSFAEFVSLLDIDEGPGVPAPDGQVDAATVIIVAGFTLLRLAGHIDETGREQTLKALEVLARYYGSPEELLRQRTDLQLWTG